ncbi:MAG: ABC transporter permease [Vicinamibacterales bacterium]
MTARTLAIARKETRELVRDPVYLGLAFVVPVALMLLFGYGLSLDVKHLPVVFVDHNRSPLSRDYIDRYVHSEYFDLVHVTSEPREADEALQRGRARVVIEIPPDFARRVAAAAPVRLGVTVDGSFPTRGEVITGYVTAINTQYSQELLTAFLRRRGVAAERASPVSMAMSVWYNPSLESKHFIVPGIIVIILMLFPALLGALLIARERESGTIFNLFASPVRRGEILAGKALPYVGVACLDYLVLYAMGRWLFDVRFTGSVSVLSLGALLYAVCTVGMGLLISVLTRSQLAAMLVTFLVTVTPAFNYSGFLAPVASQDPVGQFAARLIPATYFMDVVRGSYLKGLGLAYYAHHLLTLAAYTLIIYAAAWLALRKRIG